MAQTRNMAITTSVVPTADAPEADLPANEKERATLERIGGEGDDR